jgi:hypothetical protein
VIGFFALLLALGPDFALAPDDCGLLPPAVDTAPPAVQKASEGQASWGRAPVARVRSGPRSEGALAGKTVYLSAGHGFTWTANGWRTQRGTHNDIVEDLVSAEAIDQWVIPYLHAMGAYVVTVREPDLNPEMVIVDDAEATGEGSLVDAGAPEVGWGPLPLPLTDGAPFAAGTARSVVATASDEGRLVYAPAMPTSGEYNVYISYVQGPDRAPDAHYVVRHDGGESHFRVDQRRHGSTWVLLGKFHFTAGAAAAVVLATDSAAPGAVVSADAVRLGGGMGMIDRGAGTSGRPMYESAARYYTQWNGAPASVWDALDPDGDDDVVSRSRFTAWEHEDGEDAVYVAWHSNAPDPGVGTSSYTYSPSPPPGPLDMFTGTPGSRELQDAIHGEIVGDLRAVWDPEWTDDGRFTAYFGEVNPKHNPEVPAVLLEVAYHHTPIDAAQLRDPTWRRLVSRAIAQGIARYFAAKDGTPLVLPPEPPAAVAVRNVGGGRLRVSWAPPVADAAAGDPPTHYRVHTSRTGRGFDEGRDVFGDSFEIEGLAAGEVRYVRVAAVNDGGTSLPSTIVGARVAASGQATVAIVGGFDRLDAGLLPFEDLSGWDLGMVQRMWIARMNDGSYVVRHGEAVQAAGFSFDSATDGAVGMLELSGYQAVDWLLGQESYGDEPLDASGREKLAAYLDDGGRLLISGSEIGWAMDLNGSPAEQEFYRERLRALYSEDDAETYEVVDERGVFDGMAWSFLDGEVGGYDAAYPDVLAVNGSAAALSYDGGVEGAAGVAWGADSAGERGVYLAFPFEVIVGEEVRAEVMRRVLGFLAVEELPAPEVGSTGDEGGSSDSGEMETTGDTSGAEGTGGEGSSAGETGSGGEEAESGCGCATGAGGWWVAVLGLVRRRRRCDQ